jgi:hypothetical protein
MLSSERPPRILFSSSSTTSSSSASLLPSLHQQHLHHSHSHSQQHHHSHQQQQQHHLMRRSSSKNTASKEYGYSSSTNSVPHQATTTSSSSASVTGKNASAPIGCPRGGENNKQTYSQNYQLSSSLNYCQRPDSYSINNYYRNSAKECENRKTKSRKGESGDWHTASCKLPASRHIYSETAEVEVPTICVTNDNRRTSISSNLRFTRTFSTDSVDSLEKQCMKEVRRQRIMDEIELKDTKMLPPSSLLSPSNNGYPSLRDVGRSKTDPGTVESEGTTPIVPTKVIAGYSFDSTKLSAQLGDIAFKRSNPDLSIDGIKPRTLRDIIGITVYQAKLLLQCWPNIYSTGTSGSFASQLYSSLGKRNPKAKTILTKADGVAVFSQSDTDCTSMHTKLTLELIDTIIRTLDSSPTNMITYLTEIGQCHRNLKDEGMSTAMWDDLGDAILEGVRKNDLVRRHKELRRAWLAIIAFITDNIKQGHNTFKASPSTNDINDRNKEQN